MQSRIRLHRTGLVVFTARILSILTGMFFLIMVTGWLSPARFGLWEVILSLVAIASYPAGWIGFWTTRDVARGSMLGKTAVALNLALSAIAVLVYTAYSILGSSHFHTSLGPFLLAAIIIPLAYWSGASSAIASGHDPEALGYAIVLSEVGKLLVAYPALFVFKLEINGVILAVITSYLVQAFILTVLVRRAVGEPLNLGAARRWISDSWVPAFNSLGTAIANIDTVAASAVTGAFVLAGYYQAAYQVGSLVSYTVFLSLALYPLLLRGQSDEVTNATLDLILMFGIPMAVGAIVLAPHLLALLNPAYVVAGGNVSLPLGILAVAGLATAISTFLDSALMGKETIDLGARRGFRAYLGSAFAFVAVVNAAYAVTYLASVILAAWLGTAAGVQVSAIVEVWASSQLVFLSVAIFVKLRRLGRVSKLRLPKSLPRYLLVSVVMAGLLLALATVVPMQGADRLWNGVRIAGVVGLGGLAYFGLLFLVDRKARRLASALVQSLARGTQAE